MVRFMCFIFSMLCFLLHLNAQDSPKSEDIVKMSTHMRSISFHMTFYEDTEINIDWGDGTSENYEFKMDTWNKVSHFYSAGDNHKVTVNGDGKLLKRLNLHGTYIDNLDITRSEKLVWLRISYTYLPILNLLNNYEIKHLYAGDCLVEKIDIWNNADLELVVLYNTPLESNSSELIEFAKSLPSSLDSIPRTIYLQNKEAISWLEPVCKEKRWEISNEYYR